jgi:endonuclease/exonuclease/phosphatase family metal-dependent hydrolase
MTFNMNGKCGPDVQFLLDKMDADIVCAQECELSPNNQYAIFNQGKMWNNTHNQCILYKRHLSLIDVSKGRFGAQFASHNGNIWVFNCHLAYHPYQPFQTRNIPYMNDPAISNSNDAIISANNTRIWQIKDVLNDIGDRTNVILCGDFNEPSHVDWVKSNRNIPFDVKWPTTSLLCNNGFIDQYRAHHHDVNKYRGYTWPTPIYDKYAELPPERIDYIFSRAITSKSIYVIGENTSVADIAVIPYVSDHRAILALF